MCNQSNTKPNHYHHKQTNKQKHLPTPTTTKQNITKPRRPQQNKNVGHQATILLTENNTSRESNVHCVKRLWEAAVGPATLACSSGWGGRRQALLGGTGRLGGCRGSHTEVGLWPNSTSRIVSRSGCWPCNTAPFLSSSSSSTSSSTL